MGHSEEARKIYNFCGSKSGRDFDKAKETGLVPVETENGSIGFEQARLTLECRKLYKDSMTAKKFLDKSLLQWYGAKGGFHDVYVVRDYQRLQEVKKINNMAQEQTAIRERQDSTERTGTLRGDDV